MFSWGLQERPTHKAAQVRNFAWGSSGRSKPAAVTLLFTRGRIKYPFPLTHLGLTGTFSGCLTPQCAVGKPQMPPNNQGCCWRTCTADASKDGKCAARKNTVFYKQHHYELLNDAAHLKSNPWTVPICITHSSAEQLITQLRMQIAMQKSEN